MGRDWSGAGPHNRLGSGRWDDEPLDEIQLFLDKYVPQQYQLQIRNAFGDDMKVTTLSKDTVVYRYYGGNSEPSSYWATSNKTDNPIEDLALPPGNTAENVIEITIPAGTEVLEGTVAPNFGQPGGGQQYYIPNI